MSRKLPNKSIQIPQFDNVSIANLIDYRILYSLGFPVSNGQSFHTYSNSRNYLKSKIGHMPQDRNGEYIIHFGSSIDQVKIVRTKKEQLNWESDRDTPFHLKRFLLVPILDSNGLPTVYASVIYNMNSPLVKICPTCGSIITIDLDQYSPNEDKRYFCSASCKNKYFFQIQARMLKESNDHLPTYNPSPGNACNFLPNEIVWKRDEKEIRELNIIYKDLFDERERIRNKHWALRNMTYQLSEILQKEPRYFEKEYLEFMKRRGYHFDPNWYLIVFGKTLDKCRFVATAEEQYRWEYAILNYEKLENLILMDNKFQMVVKIN